MNLHSEAEVLAELIIALSADTEQNKKLLYVNENQNKIINDF